MHRLQAEELKEKQEQNQKLVNDLEGKQTRCSKLVNFVNFVHSVLIFRVLLSVFRFVCFKGFSACCKSFVTVKLINGSVDCNQLLQL